VLIFEIGLAVFVAASLFAAWRRPGPWRAVRSRRDGDDDGGAGAGDRAGLRPRSPVLSGGAAKRLGEDP
jgi:hypothetical protein